MPLPIARPGCYLNDGALRADFEQRGFVEVRRYWRMKVDHWSFDGLKGTAADDPRAPAAVSVPLPDSYALRAFRDLDADWRGVHFASATSFLDHFDSTPLDFDTWRGRHQPDRRDETPRVGRHGRGQRVRRLPPSAPPLMPRGRPGHQRRGAPRPDRPGKGLRAFYSLRLTTLARG